MDERTTKDHRPAGLSPGPQRAHLHAREAREGPHGGAQARVGRTTTPSGPWSTSEA